MQNSLFRAICHMGIFMICIRAIIQFRPNEAYEKYLRLLAGIMIMIQLFLPVGRFILGRGGEEAAEILRQFKRELERGMEDAAESASAADALLEQMTLEEVQRRLEEAAQGGEADGESGMRQGGEADGKNGMRQGGEAGVGNSMGQGGEAGVGNSMRQGEETGDGSGMRQGGEAGDGNSMGQGGEANREYNMGQNGESTQKTGTGQGSSMSQARETSSWDDEKTAIQIEEIEPVLVEPIQ